MQKVTVIGAGTMGNGIAHVFAQYGNEVSFVDVSNERLQQGMAVIEKNLRRMVTKQLLTETSVGETLNRIHTFTSLEEASLEADLVIEAVSERKELKLSIFKLLDGVAPKNAILATNTSSISVSSIADATKRKDKVVGMHFMNPVPIMKLVEVVRGKETSNETVEKIVSYSNQLEKTPVVVNDFPGFVANRILMPMINEAIFSLQQGVAGAEEIDQIMKLGMSHPMGPLKLADLIGLDVCLSIMQVLKEGFKSEKYAPCPLLVKMVASGKLGIKSGEGFYKYP